VAGRSTSDLEAAAPTRSLAREAGGARAWRRARLLAVLAAPAIGGVAMALTLTSPAFGPNGAIPKKHTCEGDDVSPALVWSGVPAGAKSLAIIVDDPDAPDPAAPRTTWVHWVVYDIPPTQTGLPEGAGRSPLPAGARDGVNDWKRPGYGGPCPPVGRHRYFHKLYALDAQLGELKNPTKATVENAMRGHVLDKTELVGTYQKGS
jgi:Raf kinase inhibitor-like YbhB/YbcL family protein